MNAFLKHALKQHSSKVISSTRRKPAASPLDDPALWLNQIWKNEAGELMVVAKSDPDDYLKMKSVVQAWSPSTQTWRLVEGPVRSLKTQIPSTSHGILPTVAVLAQSGLEVVGVARASTGASGSGLVLHLRDQAKPFDNIPMVVAPVAPLRLPDSRYGKQNLAMRVCYECPAGYVLPPWPACGFWFIPKKEFDDYLQGAGRRPLETTQR